MGASASAITIPPMDKDTFQRFAPDHFSASMFNTLKDSKDNMIPPTQLLQFANNATDCFLTHDWGKDELNRNNHARVGKINAILKEHGFRTWFDEEMMRGDIQQQMAEGIDHAACIVVFVTERYMEKVAGKGEKGQLDNCLYEFSHICKSKDRNKVIPVVMEPRCRDTSAWIGKVNYFLGSQLYVDYCSDENVTAVAEDIMGKMRQVLADHLTVTERWSQFSTEKASVTTTTRSSFVFDNQTVREAVALWCSEPSLAEEKYGHISTWNTTAVTDMKELFYNQTMFNADLSQWDVSNVTNMSGMFVCAAHFCSDLSRWNVGNVTDMSGMFFAAREFNSDLRHWNVGKVTTMRRMFALATTFNGDISRWDVSNVIDMSQMFSEAIAFTGDISQWNVSKVEDLGGTFEDARLFNGDLSKWNVSNVKSMRITFKGAMSFNGDVSRWDVHNVTDMTSMFENAKKFNIDISQWNVNPKVDVSRMFIGAIAFSLDFVRGWCVFNTDMFELPEYVYDPNY